MGRPVKLAAVDNHAADLRGVAVHVLGRRVHHDVGPVLEGTAVDWGGEGVVDNQGDAVGVGDAGHLGDVEHLKGRVRDGLGEEALRVRAEALLISSSGAS